MELGAWYVLGLITIAIISAISYIAENWIEKRRKHNTKAETVFPKDKNYETYKGKHEKK